MAGTPTKLTLAESARCFGLIFLSLLLAPVSIVSMSACLALYACVLRWTRPPPAPRQQPAHDGQKRTVLVTGVGMAKGLTLARAFYLCGHSVVGADFEEPGIPCSGRYSRSLEAFYALQEPATKSKGEAEYVQRLLEIVQGEQIDLWISCSGVASAMEDAKAKEIIEQQTSCKCIQFDVSQTLKMHEKDRFMREATRLALPIPETHLVTSHDEVLRILSHSVGSEAGRRFILKPAGVDDVNRANMTLLPLREAPLEETRFYVSRLPITPSRPWVLQKFIPGGEEYCTHALVIRGEVKCFVACPSAELLMHYRALPPSSAMSRAMLAFTREFVTRSGDAASLTGHLSFDFMVEDGDVDECGFAGRLYAIECNPRAHTAVVLFAQQGPAMEAMVEAYLSVIDSGTTADKKSESTTVRGSVVVPPPNAKPRYWLGHDLVSLVLQPACHAAMGRLGFGDLIRSCAVFFAHVFTWKEGTLEVWDLMPGLVLYHVYWPLTFLSAWWHGRRWSRINVSTTKMFSS